MRWPLAALAGLAACAAAGADRPERHFLAVSSTSYDPIAPGPIGQVVLFDRETAAPFARFDFPGRAYAPAVTADGSGVYVVAAGPQSGVGVVDLGSAQLRSFVAIPDLTGGFTMADDRVLVLTSTGVAAVDASARSLLAAVPCPAMPSHLVYDGANGHAYAAMIGRQDLCVVTPDLEAEAPLPTPLDSRHVIDNELALGGNLLLITTAEAGQYTSYVLDVESGRSARVPALDGVYPMSVSPEDSSLLLGSTAEGIVTYRMKLGPDGVPAFTAQGPPEKPAFRDDLYAYPAVVGSCGTPEGPVMCSVGFRMVDLATGAEVRSFLFAPRSAVLTLSAVRPFGSSVSPPRRSQR